MNQRTQQKLALWLRVIFWIAAVAIGVASIRWARSQTPVQFIGIGASSQDESVRKLGHGLPQNGWYGSVIDQRLEAYAAEFRKRGLPVRVMLHNPWGTQNEQIMDFDQRIEAGENPRVALAVVTFGPWLETRLRPLLGEDGECILYIGSIAKDPDMIALEGKPGAYRQRLCESLGGIPDWCSIAFDATSSVTAQSPAYAAILQERNNGRRVYVEARPHAASDVKCFDVICRSSFWNRSDPEKFPGSSSWAASNAECTGEILRFETHGSEETRRKWAEATIADGHTLLARGDDLVNWGFDLYLEAVK